MKAIADSPQRNPMTMSQIPPERPRAKERKGALSQRCHNLLLEEGLSDLRRTYAPQTPRLCQTTEDRKGRWEIHFLRKAYFTHHCKCRIRC